MGKKYYIAYGSNLNILQMRTRCPSARLAGISMIRGYELLFKGSKTGSYLTIEKRKDGKVPVAVWTITPEDELALDRYEGFPMFYYKAEMELPIRNIHSRAIREQSCFVYIMHEERPLGVPSWQYMQTCLEGYDDFCFDKNILWDAYYASIEEVRA